MGPQVRISEPHRQFFESQKVARLATVDLSGNPHVVPVCFALSLDHCFVPLDAKPKTVRPFQLKRVQNILKHPSVCLIADQYSDDWSKLGFVLIRGSASILEHGPSHIEAIKLLKNRYTQYLTMGIEEFPIISIEISSVSSWGNLTPGSYE